MTHGLGTMKYSCTVRKRSTNAVSGFLREEAVEVCWQRGFAVHHRRHVDDPCRASRLQQRPQPLRERKGTQHIDLHNVRRKSSHETSYNR